ncbi:MAG: CvpA family protein [Lachnospiraceae bacterium]|nr:CvpA family protein [Lachnospiraceae bacterium]
MNILTVIVAAYLLFTVFRAVRKGFFRSIFSMVFLWVVILAMLVMTPFVKTQFEQSEYVSGYVERQSAAVIAASGMNGGTVPSLTQASSPDEIAAVILALAVSTDSVKSAAADQISDVIITIFAAVATFVIALILGFVLQFIVGRLIKAGHVSMLDHVLGFPLGLAKALLVVWLWFGVIELLSFTAPFTGLLAQIRQSPFLTLLADHNLLSAALTGLIKGVAGA